MKFEKHIEYKPNKQIWRILITDDENIVIEKRDTADKQVYFDSFELESNQNIFSDLQLDEKFWIGIEKVYRGVILFHKYSKPDMPGHKEIIAYDVKLKQVLWRNEELSYLFVYDGKVYCFKQQFEGRNFYTLNYQSGELIEDLGNNAERVNSIYNQSREEEGFDDYIFPGTFESENEKVSGIIKELKSNLEILGEVEYTVFRNVLFASYHSKVFDNSMVNKFTAIDSDNGKELLNLTLTPNTESFMTDSFFVYKNFLFLLKGKEELDIYIIN
ncbi:hypothetical protein ASZ90_003547 [hydrocarbon metagenome]|uniref:DUF4905 domain-containing protein n=1 Tax=hydrocarbon metagenome TaxID=938273 RepID=A0A0W8G0D3_9ZZZZ